MTHRQVVVITGASAGIARATARQFGARGAQVALLARGQERFNIHCAVCHGRAGDGKGVTPLYGMQGVASYHQEKYRVMPDGEIFNTITNGKNTMLGYGTLVTPSPPHWRGGALQRAARSTAARLLRKQRTSAA